MGLFLFGIIFGDMSIILNIETATTNCSVSISKEGEVVALKEFNSPNYSHSEKLHVFIQDIVAKADLAFSDLDAVAVSKGPGSYTGLRIGVSASKGLCFSLDIPLISIPTLESMANQYKGEGVDFIIPLLDARRMEVYSEVYDRNLEKVRETRAEIVEADSFKDYAAQGKVLLMGSGAAKCIDVLGNQKFSFEPTLVPSAKELSILSYKKLLKKDFEDVAYFEPFYLKDFILQQKKV